MTKNPWPEDMVKELRKLVEEGKTGGMIYRELTEKFPEHTFSRNGVIGKIYRSGMRCRGESSKPAVIKKKTLWTPDLINALKWMCSKKTTNMEMCREFKSRYNVTLSDTTILNKVHQLGFRPKNWMVKQAAPAKQVVSVVTSPQHNKARGVPMDALSKTGCKWEVGDTYAPVQDFRFCNEDRYPGYPYCIHHLGLAYSPAKTCKYTWQDDYDRAQREKELAKELANSSDADHSIRGESKKEDSVKAR